MQATQISSYTLSFSQLKSYKLSALFIAGNLALPQLCHLVPNGGSIFLPIFFFTLIASYKYGWKVGLLVALLSPTLNHLIFGMPLVENLPLILFKSTMLVASATFAARKFKGILSFVVAVALYQAAGTLLHWATASELSIALQSLKLSTTGMLLQIVAGWAICHKLR